MHKAPTHAIGLLMTGPYADTLTAMSNYFKYTGEGQSWADLWEVERGERGREERWNKRKEAQFTFFHPSNRFKIIMSYLIKTVASISWLLSIPFFFSLDCFPDDAPGTWQRRWFLPVRSSPGCLSIRFQADLPGLVVLHYKPCPCCGVFCWLCSLSPKIGRRAVRLQLGTMSAKSWPLCWCLGVVCIV